MECCNNFGILAFFVVGTGQVVVIGKRHSNLCVIIQCNYGELGGDVRWSVTGRLELSTSLEITEHIISERTIS